MPSKVVEALSSFLKKRVAAILESDPSPPRTYFEFGAWAAANLNEKEIYQFEFFMRCAEPKEANDWIAQAMVDSGRYFCDPKGFVRVKEDR